MIEHRDALIADQENLLNAYRCLFGVDAHAVPGGCPDPDLIEPGPAPANPTQGDLEVRDRLIADQEDLLNDYRCKFSVDVGMVPGGCVDGAPSTNPVSTPAPTPSPDPTEPSSASSSVWEFAILPAGDGWTFQYNCQAYWIDAAQDGGWSYSTLYVRIQARITARGEDPWDRWPRDYHWVYPVFALSVDGETVGRSNQAGGSWRTAWNLSDLRWAPEEGGLWARDPVSWSGKIAQRRSHEDWPGDLWYMRVLRGEAEVPGWKPVRAEPDWENLNVECFADLQTKDGKSLLSTDGRSLLP